MKRLVTTLAIVALAALGGAAVAIGEFDDAPGAALIGLLLILGAVALGAKAAQREG